MLVRPFVPATDTDPIARINHLAFHVPEADVRGWLTRAGHDHVRVMARDAEVLGSLIVIPMGQFWGGERVAMHGIAGVAVAPEARGAGVASTLMETVLQELHDAGVPLSALFASTRALYRGVGYDVAGVQFRHDVPFDALRPARRAPVRRADPDRVRARYTRWARHRDGWLDRGPYIWQRVFEGAEAYEVDSAHVVVAPFQVDGRPAMIVRDMAADSTDGVQAILGHLAGYGTVARTCRFLGAATHPVLEELLEHRATTTLKEPWMLRLVRVQEALASRGYPPGLEAELHLEVDDPLLEANAGRWLVRIARGRAMVTRGGRGDVQIDVRPLASMYAGHRSPWDLRILGHLAASDAQCAALGAAFAGQPSVHDYF